MVTNLFYWNNIVHDVTHGYGFDEAAGNFQVNNYGNGGLGNDDVRAEAQDGSGKNNANFGTGVEGVRPRMQMFEWRSSVPNPVTVAAPSPIAGTYFGPMAGFGESLVTTGPITGTAFLVNDGAGISTTDGCEPFAVPAGRHPADRPRQLQLHREGQERAERRRGHGHRAQQHRGSRHRHGRRRPHHHHPLGHGQPGRRQPVQGQPAVHRDPRRRHRRRARPRLATSTPA